MLQGFEVFILLLNVMESNLRSRNRMQRYNLFVTYIYTNKLFFNLEVKFTVFSLEQRFNVTTTKRGTDIALYVRRMMMRVFIAFFLSIFLGFQARASVFEKIKTQKVGICLGVTSLHSDTALHTQTQVVLKDGELVEILSTSKELHFDKDENQKFRWYKVKTENGNEGWLFGDALALTTPIENLDKCVVPFYQLNYSFGAGFEDAMIWFANIEGIELRGNQYLNDPFYIEQYLVVTNAFGKSVSLYLSGKGVEGIQQLKSFFIKDINGDEYPDFIVEKSAFNEGSLSENRNVEIYQIKTRGFQKTFDEVISLKLDKEQPSPAINKVIELDNQLIRVSYIDFIVCKDKENIKNLVQQFCPTYVTYTHIWDFNTGQFKILYGESRVPVNVFSKGNYRLLSSINSKDAIANIAPDEVLIVKDIFQLNEEKPEVWLQVETSTNIKGYLPAFKVYLGDIEHSEILHEYFNNPPSDFYNWKWNEPFLFFNEPTKNEE